MRGSMFFFFIHNMNSAIPPTLVMMDALNSTFVGFHRQSFLSHLNFPKILVLSDMLS